MARRVVCPCCEKSWISRSSATWCDPCRQTRTVIAALLGVSEDWAGRQLPALRRTAEASPGPPDQGMLQVFERKREELFGEG